MYKVLIRITVHPGPPFFPNSNSFGVFSHSKGFGAEWLFASLWFSGADPSWAPKRFRGRFHQGSTKEGQGSTKVPRFSGADPSWASKRFRGRFHQGRPRFHRGSTKVPQSFHQAHARFHQGCTKEGKGSTEVPPRNGFLGQIRVRLPKGSVEGSTKVAARKVKVPSRFMIETMCLYIYIFKFIFIPFYFIISSFFSPTALALGSLAIVKVSGQTPPPAFLGANSVGLEKSSVEGSPNFSLHLSPSLVCSSGALGQIPSASKKVLWRVPPTLLYICLPVLSVLLGPWGKFRRPRKRFCGGFPQRFYTFVSQSSLRKSYLEGSPNFSLHLSPRLLFEKGYVEGAPNASIHLSPSLLFAKVIWKVPSTFLYICLPVFCSKKVMWKVPPTFLYFYTFVCQSSLRKSYLEGSPNFSLHLSRSLLFEKGYVEGSPNVSVHLSPSLLFEKGYLEGSANVSLHLSPSLLFEKGYVEGSPNVSIHLSASLLFAKVSWKVPPTFLYICLPVFCSKKVMWKVPPTFLYICLLCTCST